MMQVDVAVLAAVREDVFTPDLVDDVLARAQELEADPQSGRRDRLADELAVIDRQLGNLTEAIALGGHVPVLVARVQETDRRRQELALQIRQLGERPVIPRIDWRAAERHARGLLTEWRALLAEQPSDARPLFRELLAGEPIRFTPIDEPSRRFDLLSRAKGPWRSEPKMWVASSPPAR